MKPEPDINTRAVSFLAAERLRKQPDISAFIDGLREYEEHALASRIDELRERGIFNRAEEDE